MQTSTAIGQGPDIMTYHASRLPLGVSQGVLSEITDADMKSMGLSADSFDKTTWDAAHVDGKQYAVPFDTHPIVLYYNKDKLAAAGLIGADGLADRPQRGRQFPGRAEETEGGRQQMGHLDRHRGRQLRLPDNLFAALPAGRADRRRRQLVPRRQPGQAGQVGRHDRKLGQGRRQSSQLRLSDHRRPVHARATPR